MEKVSISSYKALVAQYGTPISDEEFKELREYANSHGIKLSGFKDFVGDIQTIKWVIDDIYEIAQDFPLILDERNGVWIELDYNLETDFATTMNDHIIHLNAGYFSDLPVLEKEYNDSVSQGRFVTGTDWRAVARHETGHVVANLYQIDPMDIALKLKDGQREAEILEILGDELSLYSAEYDDGREIISESFSAVYGKVENEFAKQFVKQCEIVSKEGR